MDRRQFLTTLGVGAAAFGGKASTVRGETLSTQAPAPRATKNWAWLRGDIGSMDQWRRSLARMKRFGIDYYRFMCPSRDEVRQAIRSTVRDLVQVDGLGSIQLDYIRYPDVILPIALWPKYNLVQDREYPELDFCYCSVCRERFRKQSGADPLELADPAANAAWLQYRYDTITAVVQEVASEAHAHNTRVTEAVFPTPAIAKRLVRQDWTRWDVDAVLPMVYNGFYKEDVPWIERATREGVTALAGRMPLYTGLHVPDLGPADLARAAERAFAGGALSISVFEGNTLTPEHWSLLAPVLKAHRARA